MLLSDLLFLIIAKPSAVLHILNAIDSPSYSEVLQNCFCRRVIDLQLLACLFDAQPIHLGQDKQHLASLIANVIILGLPLVWIAIVMLHLMIMKFSQIVVHHIVNILWRTIIAWVKWQILLIVLIGSHEIHYRLISKVWGAILTNWTSKLIIILDDLTGWLINNLVNLISVGTILIFSLVHTRIVRWLLFFNYLTVHLHGRLGVYEIGKN